MIRITQLKVPVAEGTQELEAAICKRLAVQPAQLRSWKLYRRSLDARRGRELAYVYTVDVQVERNPRSGERSERNRGWRGLPVNFCTMYLSLRRDRVKSYPTALSLWDLDRQGSSAR